MTMVVNRRNRLAPCPVSSAVDDMKSTVFIREIEKQMKKDGQAYVKKVKGIIGFRVLGEGGKEVKWIIDAKNGSGSLELNSKNLQYSDNDMRLESYRRARSAVIKSSGHVHTAYVPTVAPPKPDCTITMKDGDLVDLMTGKLNPNTAFFNGKLKISGNMGVAMKIQSIMPAKPKL